MRIALLEDDPAQAAFAIEAMTTVGYICRQFLRGRELVHELRRQTYDLLMLDWMPDMSGDELLCWVRQGLHAHVPVIFVTDRGHEYEVASILDAGADDYIVKPVPAVVLVARVASVLRRAYRTSPANGRATFAEYEFDSRVKQVWKSGVQIPLTQREFALALLLFQNLGRPLSREHILEVVWSQRAEVLSRTMDTHISWLRTKLDLRQKNGYCLAPVYGYGYRLEQTSDASAARREIQLAQPARETNVRHIDQGRSRRDTVRASA
jgi:DNA-binding response OmpR family regulator